MNTCKKIQIVISCIVAFSVIVACASECVSESVYAMQNEVLVQNDSQASSSANNRDSLVGCTRIESENSPVDKAVNPRKKMIVDKSVKKLDDRVILFLNYIDDSSVTSTVKKMGLKTEKVFQSDGTVIAEKKSKTTWNTLKKRAANIANIKAFMPNYSRVRLSSLKAENSGMTDTSWSFPENDVTTNDPLFNKQWFLSKEYGINAPLAWRTTMGSSDVKVAIIDSGYARTNEELKGRVISEYDPKERDNNASDTAEFSHGSHVSGIIAANANNNYGISGIAPLTSLIEIDCFEYNKELDDDIASDASLFEAFDICVSKGVRIANMSFGTFVSDIDSDLYNIYINKLKAMDDAGIICVSAAGNEKTDQQCIPADVDSVIGVIALSKTRKRATYSNYGYSKDISAPGDDILSIGNATSFVTGSGTSMAAPMVSGALALMAARCPFASNEELLEIMYDTTIDLGYSGKDREFANGCLDIGAAMTELNKRYPVELTNTDLSNLVLSKGDTKQFSIKAYHKAKVSISVYFGVDKQVCTLLNNKNVDNEKIDFVWDGKDSSGIPVENGTYRIVVDVNPLDDNLVVKQDGFYSMSYSFQVSDEDYEMRLPKISLKLSKKKMTLSGFQKMKITLSAPKETICDLQIIDSNNDVSRTVADNITCLAGMSYDFKWDCCGDDGFLVGPGVYSAVVVAKNQYASRQTVEKFTVAEVPVTKTTGLKLSRRKIQHKKIRKTTELLSYKLNTESAVTVRILSSKKKKVSLVQKKKIMQKGKHKLRFKLKANNKWLKKGKYFIEFIAYNSWYKKSYTSKRIAIRVK